MKIWAKPWCACLNFIAAGAQLSQTEPLTPAQLVRIHQSIKSRTGNRCLFHLHFDVSAWRRPSNSYYRPISCTQPHHTNTETFVCKQTHAEPHKAARHLHSNACSGRLGKMYTLVWTGGAGRPQKHANQRSLHRETWDNASLCTVTCTKPANLCRRTFRHTDATNINVCISQIPTYTQTLCI